MSQPAVLRFLAASLALMAGAAASHSAAQEINSLAVLAGSTKAEAQREAQLLQQLRDDAARPVRLVAPFVEPSSSRVILLNVGHRPIETDLFLVEPQADRYPIGQFVIPPERPLELSLSQALEGRNHSASASLVANFVGDPEILQGWVILQRDDHLVELPMISPELDSEAEFLSFWRESEDSSPMLAMVNAHERVLTVSLELHSNGHLLELSKEHLAPGEQRLVRPSALRTTRARAGLLRVRHDGPPGSLIAAGLLEGPGTMISLPWLAQSQTEGSRAFTSTRAPSGAVTFTVASPHSNFSRVTARIVDSLGLIVARESTDLAPRAVANLSLRVPETPDTERPSLRLELHSDHPILASGYAVGVSGAQVDLGLFDADSGHTGGFYPLLPLAENDTVTTLVNLGPEAATIGIQVTWPGGAYTYGPIHIPGQSSYQLSIDELASRGPADPLGRKLDPRYEAGLLRWTLLSGKATLVARTEVQPRNSADRFGFNCYGCCYQLPFGEVVPSATEVLPGQSSPLQACVSFQTCSGTMGPFPIVPKSITSPTPFTWDGANITSSAAGEENVFFVGEEVELKISCGVDDRNIYAGALAKGCKASLRKTGRLTQFWSATAACTAQVGDYSGSERCTRCEECCEKQKANFICKKKPRSFWIGEYNACIGHCATDHC